MSPLGVSAAEIKPFVPPLKLGKVAGGEKATLKEPVVLSNKQK